MIQCSRKSSPLNDWSWAKDYEAVALYPDWEDLQAEYPELEKEDIRLSGKQTNDTQ